jgi:phospholipid-binding lipoprotein MlaA
VAAAIALALPGATSAAEPSEPVAAAPEPINDPLEPLNRVIFTFNDAADVLVLRPAAEAYQIFVPPEARERVTNVLRNLKSPIILANDVLQGQGRRAGYTIVRFFINSTIGILGLFDPASHMGFPYHDEDFGQTLAVWGAGEGFYLVLPILGPSNPRDTLGIVVDFVGDPVRNYLRNTNEADWAEIRTGSRITDGRARSIEVVDDIKRTSLDYYAAVRSLYSQRRAVEIRNAEPGEDGNSLIFFPMTDPGTGGGGS